MTGKDSKTSLPTFHSSAHAFDVFCVGSWPLHVVNHGEKIQEGPKGRAKETRKKREIERCSITELS